MTDAESKPRMLKQPYVDLNRCVGCGACEFSCPLQEQPGVYVTSAGESRSRLRSYGTRLACPVCEIVPGTASRNA